MTTGTILLFLLIVLVMMLLVIGCAFGGLWLGAFIHYRGVAIGHGNLHESFTGKVPEGEVFRISTPGEADQEPPEVVLPGSPEDIKVNGTMGARAERFLNTMLGGPQ